ncbi:MAG: LuxR C-terminal-related transcriptional regulator [Bdellovibrio sp.]|uniref:helix-turn-helix transcriptional regulator n=1 Tax=Bdellovibrio sp. TaxID=28201 RepID=UPI0039E5E92D|nr:LuxR C-terminal-related transcriptional regulator [Bdellovibrio sp.]
MNQRERMIIVSILVAIAVMMGVDVVTDSSQGVAAWHVLAEGAVAVAALVGVFFILRGSIELKHQLAQERKDFSEFKIEAEKWRAESRKYLEGLSKAIDQQLSKWQLTAAEKEVAFLLLKGLSLKEIAEIRQTSDKTARVQSMAIYSKSGLAGRSELSAFFLEDLLVPQQAQENS